MALWTPTIFSVAVATSTWLSGRSLIGLVEQSSHISFLMVTRNCGGAVGHRQYSLFSLGGRWKKRRSGGEITAVALDEELPPPPPRSNSIPRLYRNSSDGRGRFLRPPPKFHPRPFSYLQELDLRIESLSNTGYGVARYDNPSSEANSWVVMVPFTIPGERVTALVYRNHKNFSEASLVSVLERSKERVEPRCKLYGLCGGCQYQHMSIKAQREWKMQHVFDCLHRIAGLPVEEICMKPAIGTSDMYGYRNKITPHHDGQPDPSTGKLSIGFNRARFPMVADLSTADTHRILDVPECPIATARINEALPSVRAIATRKVLERTRDGLKARGATLLLREATEGVVTDFNKQVTEVVSSVSFNFIAAEFFQTNMKVLPLMTEYVVRQAKMNGARFLIDCYCGGGLFCITAAQMFEQCAGIEISGQAISQAKQNAAKNGIENCVFLAGTASDIFGSISFHHTETAIIIDPPRKGCDGTFLSQLARFSPSTIVYVSCDPATQARDTAAILKEGYRIPEVQIFDMFPQTRHIERLKKFLVCPFTSRDGCYISTSQCDYILQKKQ